MQILRPRPIVASLGMALSALALATSPIAIPAVRAQEAPAAADAPATPAPAAPEGTTAPGAVTAPAADAGSPAATPATPAPATPDGAAAPGAGNPAQQEPMEIVKATFDDWQVRCAPQGNDCFLYQLALDQGKNPVAEVSLLKLPASSEAAAGVTVVSPLGTLLTTGVVLQIDNGEKRSYPFAWCSQVGCFSRFGLSQQSVDALKRGNAATLTLVSVNRPDAPVSLAVSLKGFTAAFDSLEAPPSPPGAAPANRAAPAPAAPAKPLPNLLPRN
ncbi:MAG: invasion associated locus B family protein [Amaricoccus sp.]|uniref:invasion associated locus B family protein n=1 Tax=Amaricoccus sp. TaxID=1872485 RepID=UPI0039E55B66